MTLSILAVAAVVVDVGRSLKEAALMFVETFWALVLGFGLSGAVQAFVSRDTMRRRLGDHRAAAVTRAALYGMASSSCSYAASAMTKSLFQKGADFVTSMIFMVASTNLVVELGIVLVVLIGWQFMAAEFLGGAIMIVLLAVVGGWAFRGRVLESARASVNSSIVDDDGAMVAAHDGFATAVRSLASWSDAASYSISDLKMLRREMVIGYTVAGFLAVLVPQGLWNDVFIHGHGFATTIENVVVGPLIAMVSCVCSVGNVPLAAALWKGGISFGGVVSFIFADLVALPLLAIYRRFYGIRMTIRMLITFWSVMSLAGLLTEAIFRAAGIAPTKRPAHIVAQTLSWDYTSILDLVFAGVLIFLYVLYRRRIALGGGARYATDPVCGMQVEIVHAPASIDDGADVVYFCSDRCRDRYKVGRSPSVAVTTASDRMEGPSVAVAQTITRRTSGEVQHASLPTGNRARSDVAIDPVCSMSVVIDGNVVSRTYDGRDFYFCCEGCAERFAAEPTQFTI